MRSAPTQCPCRVRNITCPRALWPFPQLCRRYASPPTSRHARHSLPFSASPCPPLRQTGLRSEESGERRKMEAVGIEPTSESGWNTASTRVAPWFQLWCPRSSTGKQPGARARFGLDGGPRAWPPSSLSHDIGCPTYRLGGTDGPYSLIQAARASSTLSLALVCFPPFYEVTGIPGAPQSPPCPRRSRSPPWRQTFQQLRLQA